MEQSTERPDISKVSPDSKDGRRRLTRRDPGDGSILQRADGRWVARLWVPNGAGASGYFYGKTKAAAKARLSEAQRTIQDGRPMTDHRVTFGAYLQQWLAGGCHRSSAQPIGTTPKMSPAGLRHFSANRERIRIS